MLRSINQKVIIPILVKDNLSLSFNIESTIEKIDYDDDMTISKLKEEINKRLEKSNYKLGSLGTLDLGPKDIEDDKPIKYFKSLWPFYINAINKNKKEGGSKESNPFISFTDISKGAILKGFSESAPKWRYVSTGLNLYGICNNQKAENGKPCVAYGKEVISKMGLGIYIYKEDKDKVRCPMCKAIITPTKASFYDCLYKFVGAKVIDNQNTLYIKYPQYYKAPSDKHVKFGENTTDNDLVEYSDFTFLTCKVTDKEPSEYEVFSSGNDCVLCGAPAKNKFEALSCGNHRVHEYCKKLYAKSGSPFEGCIQCHNSLTRANSHSSF